MTPSDFYHWMTGYLSDFQGTTMDEIQTRSILAKMEQVQLRLLADKISGSPLLKKGAQK